MNKKEHQEYINRLRELQKEGDIERARSAADEILSDEELKEIFEDMEADYWISIEKEEYGNY